MSILLGVEGGYVPPPVPPPSFIPQQWLGIQPVWHGWDGSTWDLSGRTGGVALLRGGIRGMAMPAVTRYTDQSPALAGSRWRGSRVQEREVFWPLTVYGQGSSQEWIEYDRAFWRTMHPDKPGVWQVTHPDGQTRMLRCRFVDDGSQAFDMFPSITGWANYGLTLVAEDPFWRGEPVTWSSDKDQIPEQNFWGGDASPSGGPPFYISSSNTLAKASIDNPGDVESYPTYLIEGPTSFVSVGIGDAVTEVPFAIPAGGNVQIDTDPSVQVARDNFCRDRTAELGKVSFAAVQPGEGIALTVNMVGTGRVSVSLSPSWLRAW